MECLLGTVFCNKHEEEKEEKKKEKIKLKKAVSEQAFNYMNEFSNSAKSPCHPVTSPAQQLSKNSGMKHLKQIPSSCFCTSSVSSSETRISSCLGGDPRPPHFQPLCECSAEPEGLRAPSPSHLFPGDFTEIHSPIQAWSCSSARRNEYWTICSAKK